MCECGCCGFVTFDERRRCRFGRVRRRRFFLFVFFKFFCCFGCFFGCVCDFFFVVVIVCIEKFYCKCLIFFVLIRVFGFGAFEFCRFVARCFFCFDWYGF